MTRGPRCITWSYLLIPTAQPGKFSVDNHRDPGAEAEELQVQDTDYTTFALMVSRRQSGSQSILRVYLLCEPSSASLQPRLECGRLRSRRWTNSSACSELRASQKTTSSFQAQQIGHPIRERAEG
nr:epididymal-specific lipocalin-12 isoform X4 [Desmodus rotundus]